MDAITVTALGLLACGAALGLARRRFEARGVVPPRAFRVVQTVFAVLVIALFFGLVVAMVGGPLVFAGWIAARSG